MKDFEGKEREGLDNSSREEYSLLGASMEVVDHYMGLWRYPFVTGFENNIEDKLGVACGGDMKVVVVPLEVVNELDVNLTFSDYRQDLGIVEHGD